MNANIILVATFAALSVGCATPVIMLKSEKTGQVVRCGGGSSGSLAGGMIGYHMEATSDEKCVADYEKQGFRKMP